MSKRSKTLKQNLGLSQRRKDTFVGFRPVSFRDKSKYDRNLQKQSFRRALAD